MRLIRFPYIPQQDPILLRAQIQGLVPPEFIEEARQLVGDFICDVCDRQLRGAARYHCTVCADFDQCERCRGHLCS